MSEDPFQDITIRTDAAAVATARGFCIACSEERELDLIEFTGAISLACPKCGARKRYRISSLRPAS